MVQWYIDIFMKLKGESFYCNLKLILDLHKAKNKNKLYVSVKLKYCVATA